MRRFLCILLVAASLISVMYGCQKGSNNGESTTGPEDSKPEANETFKGVSWVTEGYDKVYSEKKIPNNASTDMSIQMSKREKESFNIAIRSETNFDGLKVMLVDGARDDMTVEIFEEYYIKTGPKHYPDPIVPLTDTFSVVADESKAILVRFTTTSETEAGDHVFKFALVDGNGNTVQEYNITVTVWNITLPEYYSTETATSLMSQYITKFEKIPGRLQTQYYVKYYEMLLDYGLNAYQLPYDILNDKADAYMSDPRVKAFVVPHGVNDESLLKYYEKLKTNPVWLEKAYFYPYDEPNDTNALDELAVRCERLKRLCPEIRIVIPFFMNVKYDDATDEVDFLDQYLGIWCPKAPAWQEGWIADPLGKGYFGDRMAEQKEQGDKLWWYVCWEPGPPYNNLYVNETGLDHIKLFWQQYQHDVDGFLYWSSNYWAYIDDPWTDMATLQGWLNDSVYGDGSLIYPGKKVEIEGPVASLRLECIRNGIEDIELLKLAEEKLGREWVMEQVNKVSQTMNKHTKNNEVFNEVRATIGEALEAELNK